MDRNENEQIAWEEAQMVGISDLSEEELPQFFDAITYEIEELEQLRGLAVYEAALRLKKEI